MNKKIFVFALAAAVLLLAAALLAPPMVEAAPDSPLSIAIAGYIGPPVAADAEEPLNELTSARKGLDIAEDGADAAATAAKAGSQTTGPGRFKALRDYLRQKRIHAGDFDSPNPAPNTGTLFGIKAEYYIYHKYDIDVAEAAMRAYGRGITNSRSLDVAEDLADFYQTYRYADDINYIDPAKYSYTGSTPENPDYLVKLAKTPDGEKVFISRGIEDSEYGLWKKANGDSYNPRGAEHMIDKHLYGKPRAGQTLQPDTTTFPSTMSEEEVLKAGLKVATEGNYIPSKGVYRGTIYHNGKPIVIDSVRVSSGEVITSYPKSGVGVKKWDGSDWLTWSETANDFV